ncbi:helix-hairpin-helix domain-containing protein [Kribbella sp. NPDC051586]|uniref:helix-hairpin-helix domain-containing protein n=1 Tax=Kribbella sp. NPDC051586 TaxID=3364118 RepID=UPI00378C0D5F
MDPNASQTRTFSAVKVFRRDPVPDPAARERALARLAARPPSHAPPSGVPASNAAPSGVVPSGVAPSEAQATRAAPSHAQATRVAPGRVQATRSASGDVPPGEDLHDPTDVSGDHPRDDYLEERDGEVRGGWIPEQVRPERLRDARWTLSPRHILVLLAVLAVGLSWAAWSFLRARPEPIPDTSPTTATSGQPVAQPTPAQTQPGTNQSPGANQSSGTNQSPGANQSPAANWPPGTNQSPGSAGSPGQQLVVVYVAGKVRRPGLVRAPTGSRVADVLTLAGGPLPGVDLTTLNLARQVTDGEQITVGQPSQPQPTNPPGTTTPTAASTDPVNLNTATLDQLDALPGVGPVLAQRILDYRTQNGPFTTIDQLQDVPGVGPKKFDSLKPHVRL